MRFSRLMSAVAVTALSLTTAWAQDIKIGANLPMSGPNAEYGELFSSAAAIAVESAMVSFPPAAVGALSRHAPHAGSASALMGTMMFTMGAISALLGSLFWLADRTSTLSPDFLTEVVLIALSVTNITMLVALAFVLARNVIKSVMESRRGVAFGRFRAKLVLSMLGMTVVPAVLVLIVGSRVVLTAVDRWFNAPVAEVLTSATALAGDYYQEQQRLVSEQAQGLARVLADIPAAEAPQLQILRTGTPTWSQWMDSRRWRGTGNWFVHDHGKVELCTSLPPVRPAP